MSKKTLSFWIVGLLIAIILTRFLFEYSFNAARNNTPCCATLIRIDASDVPNIDSLRIQLCGTQTYLTHSNRDSLTVINSGSGEVTTVKFSWAEEVRWDFNDEPCDLIIWGYIQNSWEQVGYINGFEMQNTIRSGVNIGLKLTSDTSIPTLLYWP